MPSVGTEQQESITGHPAVMVARDFSGAAFGKVMFIPAGSVANVLLTRIKGINADTVDYESVLEQE